MPVQVVRLPGSHVHHLRVPVVRLLLRGRQRPLLRHLLPLPLPSVQGMRLLWAAMR